MQKCPKCGIEVEMTEDGKCSKCGADMKPGSDEAAVEEEETETPEGQPGM